MVWVKVCDNYAFHKKSRRAGLLGTGAFVHVLEHCNRELSDGVFDPADLDHVWPWDVDQDVDAIVELIQPVLKAALKPFAGAYEAVSKALGEARADASELLAMLFERLREVGFIDAGPDGTFEIHNYHRYQPSRVQVELRREKAAERQRQKRSRDRDARAELSVIALAIARASGVEITEENPLSRRDSRVTEGVTIDPVLDFGAVASPLAPRPTGAPRSSHPPGAAAESGHAQGHEQPLAPRPTGAPRSSHPSGAAAESGHAPMGHDDLSSETTRPAPLRDQEKAIAAVDEKTTEAGVAVADAIKTYKELGRLERFQLAAHATRLMQRYGKPVEAILVAVQRLARDAGGAEAVGHPMTESQLGYWFGRYCESAEVQDHGDRSEREHQERQRLERSHYQPQREPRALADGAPLPPAATADAARALLAKIGVGGIDR